MVMAKASFHHLLYHTKIHDKMQDILCIFTAFRQKIFGLIDKNKGTILIYLFVNAERNRC